MTMKRNVKNKRGNRYQKNKWRNRWRNRQAHGERWRHGDMKNRSRRRAKLAENRRREGVMGGRRMDIIKAVMAASAHMKHHRRFNNSVIERRSVAAWVWNMYATLSHQRNEISIVAYQYGGEGSEKASETMKKKNKIESMA